MPSISIIAACSTLPWSARASGAAGIPRIFRTLQLPFSSPESLNTAVTKAETFLRLAATLKHVKHLEVVSAHVLPLDAFTEFPKNFPRGRPNSECIMNPAKAEAAEPSELTVLTEVGQWEALTAFVKSLTALTELT